MSARMSSGVNGRGSGTGAHDPSIPDCPPRVRATRMVRRSEVPAPAARSPSDPQAANATKNEAENAMDADPFRLPMVHTVRPDGMAGNPNERANAHFWAHLRSM